MASNRPIDSKREEYRKYLERTGVLDALTKLLTHLYEEPEKPADGLMFIYNFFVDSFPEVFKNTTRERELDEEREKVKRLTEEVNELKSKLAAVEETETAAVQSEPEPDPQEMGTVAVADVVTETLSPAGHVPADSSQVAL